MGMRARAVSKVGMARHQRPRLRPIARYSSVFGAGSRPCRSGLCNHPATGLGGNKESHTWGVAAFKTLVSLDHPASLIP